MNNYEEQWSSANPGLLIILIDQSGSMTLPMRGNDSKTRSEYASLAVNRVIKTIIDKSFNGKTPKNRAFVSVIGYNQDIHEIASGYIQDLAASPKRLEKVEKLVADDAGGLVKTVKEMPVWVEPITEDGTTNMKGAFEQAKDILEKWVADKPDSPAPVVINISDGIPYWDRKPEEECKQETSDVVEEIQKIKTSDGNVLVFNACIGDGIKSVFPTSEAEAGDEEGKFLYKISNAIPEAYDKAAKKVELLVRPNARGCISGADAVDLIKLIDFGSSKGQSDLKH